MNFSAQKCDEEFEKKSFGWDQTDVFLFCMIGFGHIKIERINFASGIFRECWFFFNFHSCIKYDMLYKFPGILLCLNEVSLKIDVGPEIFYQKMMETDWKQGHGKTKQHEMCLGCKELNCGIFLKNYFRAVANYMFLHSCCFIYYLTM